MLFAIIGSSSIARLHHSHCNGLQPSISKVFISSINCCWRDHSFFFFYGPPIPTTVGWSSPLGQMLVFHAFSEQYTLHLSLDAFIPLPPTIAFNSHALPGRFNESVLFAHVMTFPGSVSFRCNTKFDLTNQS